MDGISAYAITRELDPVLAGSLVDRIAMEDRFRLTLTLFSPQRQKYHVSLSANPSRPTLSLSRTAPGQGLNPPPSWVMFLRKYLRRARLIKLESPPWERVFIFHFQLLDDLGDMQTLRLIFECMPRTSNLVLVNHEDVILGALRHIDHRVNRVRETLPAHPYIPPPPQNRLDPSQAKAMTADQWFRLFPKDQKPARAIAQVLAGFSPLLGTEALYRAGLSPDLPLVLVDPDGRQRLSQALNGLCSEILSASPQPGLYFDGPPDSADSRPLAVHAIHLTHLPYFKPYDSISLAVSDYNKLTEAANLFESRQQALQRRVSQQMKKEEKKRGLHEADLAEGKEAGQDKLCGELILAYLHTIPGGSDGVTLENYYQAGAPVFCPLDPRRSAAENANGYFARAKRKERKRRAAEKFLAQDLDQLLWLESLHAAAGYSESMADLQALEEELQSRKEGVRPDQSKEAASPHLPGRPASKKRRMQQTFDSYQKRGKNRPPAEGGQSLAPRRYRSSDGYLIVCGRNNLQNDQLLRKAGRQDLWFHVKDRPGSHVWVSGDQGEPPLRTLEEAAGIAAWFSEAGRSGSPVEVDYTRAIEVKKIPGTSPGNVSYQKHKTLYIKPLDPASLDPA